MVAVAPIYPCFDSGPHKRGSLLHRRLVQGCLWLGCTVSHGPDRLGWHESLGLLELAMPCRSRPRTLGHAAPM